MYHIKEAFYSLQGEGLRAGRPAIFCRFTGCNLWSGREQDRATSACPLCDTDFLGTDGQHGGRFREAQDLADHLLALWPDTEAGAAAKPYVVFTGGEPLLQLDVPLIEAMQARRFEVAVETNGTLPCPPQVDWICVSPKGHSTIVQRQGHELKLVYPQPGVNPADFITLDFEHFILQPLDGEPQGLTENYTQAALNYCLTHPQWTLGLQTHKLLNID